MEEAIKNFHTQFLWKPAVVNAERLPTVTSYILNGMGGSHLAADVLRGYRPDIDLTVFSDYGMPILHPSRLSSALFIASSYSGNTEEALDFAKEALADKRALAAIAKGGKLLEFARKHAIPHVILPPDAIQPRSGLGYQIIALATLIGDTKLLSELGELATVLKPETLRETGAKLAGELRSTVPVVYASAKNAAVAYNWKIKMNETGKIPAFYNVIPELNHNEMTGFDVIETTEAFSQKFHFIFLSDVTDHPQNQKRMQVTKKLYEDRGLPVTEIPLAGEGALERMFSSLLIADWTALHLSRIYGTEAEQVPMVEEFKRLIS